jgi:small-conductance mechanosensitive channel
MQSFRPSTLGSIPRRPLARAAVGPVRLTPVPRSVPRPARRPTRRVPPPAASAASSIVSAEVTLSRAATGVPLLEIFSTLTLQEAAVQSSILIGVAVFAVLFGNQIIEFIGKKVEAALGAAEQANGDRRPSARLARTLAESMAAAERPAQALLPYFGFTYVCTVLAAFSDVAIKHMAAAAPSSSTVASFCKGAGLRLLDVLTDLTQLMQDFSEVSLLIFCGWFFINLKNRLVENILAAERRRCEEPEDSIGRIVEPVSTLVSWATVVATTLISIKAMGFNIQPLLALGSVSTLAIGFAAQSVVANVISAFSLYASRPFVAGDRVMLKTMSGGLVVSGTVERIMPMYTVIQTDTGCPIFVRNKDVASSLLVVNESKMLRSETTPALPTLDTTVTVRYKDVDIIPAVQEEVTKWMKAHPDMLPGATCKCALKEFSTFGPVLQVKCTLKREADSRKSRVITEILMKVENTVREKGGFLALERGLELPSPMSAY